MEPRPLVASLVLSLATGCAAVTEGLGVGYAAMTGSYNSVRRGAGAGPVEEQALPHGIELVNARESLVYLVPVEGGVVLVDAGFEADGASIKAALRGRRVKGVLVTHAHRDHVEAAHLFDAPTYVGRDDLALWRHERCARAPFAHAAQHAVGMPEEPALLFPVDDGERVVLGGVVFRALALPGHTPGSTAWIFRDVAFTGDAVTNPSGRALELPPFTVTDDEGRAWRSAFRLLDTGVRYLLDAHYGVTDDARAALLEARARWRQRVQAST